jgi:hypothetical protein
MRVDRHFGTVKEAAKGGGFVILRDDGRGEAFCSQREAEAAGGLIVGDRVEYTVRPGAIAADVDMFRRARHLQVQEAAK